MLIITKYSCTCFKLKQMRNQNIFALAILTLFLIVQWYLGYLSHSCIYCSLCSFMLIKKSSYLCIYILVLIFCCRANGDIINENKVYHFEPQVMVVDNACDNTCNVFCMGPPGFTPRFRYGYCDKQGKCICVPPIHSSKSRPQFNI